MQLYPDNFFWQSLDPLIEQSGGIALDWYQRGTDPVVAWRAAQAELKQVVNKARESDLRPPVSEVIDPLLYAVGAKRATREAMRQLQING